MQRTRTLLTVCFCAGLLGALCNSLVAWLVGSWGVPAMLGVQMAPKLTAAWLYPRLVWGGIWGLAYFLAVGSFHTRRHWARKGLWISLLPTLFQLCVVFPYWTRHGWLGFGLGQFTPVLVLIYNLVWGFATGVFARAFWGARR